MQLPLPQQGSPGPPQLLQKPPRQAALPAHGVAPAQHGLPGIPHGLQTASTRDAELHRVCGSWQTPPQHGCPRPPQPAHRPALQTPLSVPPHWVPAPMQYPWLTVPLPLTRLLF